MFATPRTRACGLALALALGAAFRAPGADEKDDSRWVGTKVVTKYATPLMAGSRVVDPGLAHRVYNVEKASGGWLWLASGDVRGWAPVDRVVPLDRAVEYYDAEIRQSPRAARSYVQRGLAWFDRGEYDRAVADFTVAARLNPSLADAYAGRAAAWEARGEPEIALADLTEVVRLRPWDFKAFLDRGIAWERAGESDRAVSDFNESIRREPNNAWAFLNRGNVRRARKDLDRAIADYDQALKLDPRSSWALINRGLAWAARKDFDKAVADEDRAAQLDSKNAYAYHNRAVFLGSLGRYRQAADDFETALRLDPRLQAARAGLALLLASCPDEKLRDGRRAVELAGEAYRSTNPEEPSFGSALAAAYAEAGDFPRAVTLQERARGLTADPGEREEFDARLALYRAGKPYRRGPVR
jgi:tetratricopeptide (TPR) repeat protein